MNQRSIIPRIAMSAIAATVLAAGCSASVSPRSSASGSATEGNTTGDHSSGSGPASSRSASSGSPATTSAFYPVAVGNTWVYQETDLEGRETVTNKMISVTPIAGGQQVTLLTTGGVPGRPGAVTSTTATMIFRSDGSILVPLTQLGTATVQIKSGAIIWPNPAGLASGRPHRYTVVVDVTQDSITLTADVLVTVKGGGSSIVRVPAGTFRATLVSETMAADIAGVSVNIDVRTWVARGIGPVRIAAQTGYGSTSSQVSTEVLESFIHG
jgi:hypothetical protein